jgi:hypothetical protein
VPVPAGGEGRLAGSPLLRSGSSDRIPRAPSPYNRHVRTRIQSGRVRGYQPTLTEFSEILELAQRGMDASDAAAELHYQRDSEVTTSGKDIGRITAEHVSKLIEESRAPKSLLNLRFSSSQENPARSVVIAIDPDGWTYYRVESSDFTWALGRFQELTELLLANRRLPARAQFPLPEVLASGRYRGWGAVLWVPSRDWRVTLARWFKESPFWFPFLIAVAFTASPPSFSAVRGIAFTCLVLAYAAALSAYFRWLKDTYKSYVSVSRSQLNIISLITGKEADPVSRATLLFTVAGVLVAALSTVIDALR